MKLLITAGPTREFIDPVRFISNAAGGRMGYALAVASADRGHTVVLVSGPVAIEAPPSVQTINVVTAQQMLEACAANFETCDAAIMTAAVTDWRPRRRADHKLPKSESMDISLEQTPDICRWIGERKDRRILVGFAVQDDAPRERAEEKMARKHCDVMVLNSPRAIGSESSKIEIKCGDAPWQGPFSGDKSRHAVRLVTLVEQLIAERGVQPAVES